MIVLVIIVALSVVGLRYANSNLLDRRLVDVRALPDSLLRVGFSLSSDRDLQVDLLGAVEANRVTEEGGPVIVTLDRVWIVNAGTKETVWDMRDNGANMAAGGTVERRGTVSLPAGDYVFFCTTRTGRQRNRDVSWVSWLDATQEGSSSEARGESGTTAFRATVSGRGKRLSADETTAALAAPVERDQSADEERSSRYARPRARTSATRRSATGRVLVDLTRLEDDEAKFGHFSLSRRTDVNIYAVGEGTNTEMYDYGWIVNTANGRTVWQMEYRDTEHAGGDRKNRFIDETISLGRGNYVVYFVTDESHSYDGWNASAPFEQEAWGIRVTEAAETASRGSRRMRESEQWTPIAELTGIRDDMHRRTHFSLDRRTRVRVYALGEGDADEMYDFAWLVDAESGATIWEMKYRHTRHAGGANKNRLVDSTGWLPAGEYVLRYQSDESHSPESWNTAPPDDLRNYGVTVFIARR